MYKRFSSAAAAAESNPGSAKLAKALTRWAKDPARGEEDAALTDFYLNDIVFKGTPPQPRVTVTSVQMSAKPYPRILLASCPTLAPTWRPYDANTGKPLKIAPPPAKPPHLASVEVVFYQGRWLVQTLTTDRKHTCSPG